jgi:hypothetical protein
MDAVLTKPINLTTLLRAVADVLSSAAAQPG